MIINLKRVAKIIEEKKSNLVLPKFADKVTEAEYYRRHVLNDPPRATPEQLNPLWLEFNKVRTERAQLSNKLFDQVKGGATTHDLKPLVDSIKDFQPRLENLFDQARHVDQYGTMPKIEVKQEESTPEQKP